MQLLGSWIVVVLFLLVGQVPPPALGTDAARELEAARRSILANEGAQLKGLAERLAKRGDQAAASRCASGCPGRSTRMAQRVSCRSRSGEGSSPGKRGRAVACESERDRVAIGLKSYSSWPSVRPRPTRRLTRWPACVCVRSSSGSPIIARRGGCWDTCRMKGAGPRPFAVSQLKKGYVSHPIFGWVLADWVPHLDRGELPAPRGRGQKKARWLSAAEADGLRANWSPPWCINTEHFEIQTNVTLAEAISFGRRLEAFHDLFMALLADILGENLPLVRRFKDPAMTGEPAYRPHSVYYFGSKSEYVDYLRPQTGARDRQEPWLLRSAQSRAVAAACRPISSATPTASCR